MKELFVNKEACIGCGACVAIDPEHFDFDEDGYSSVISQEGIEKDEVKNAMSSCPTNAISYVETSKDVEEHACEHCEKHGQCEHHEDEDFEGFEAA